MIPLLFSKAVYAARRQRLAESLEPNRDLVVYFQAPERIRNHDNHFKHRPDSGFLYLTGYAEPDAAFLLWREKKAQKIVTFFKFFVLPRDLTQEQWTGFRYGKERAGALLGIDDCQSIDAFPAAALEAIKSVPAKGIALRILTNANGYPERKINLERIIETYPPHIRQGRLPIAAIEDISMRVGGLRLVKDDEEIKVMRKSSQINVEAHLKAMKTLKPGMKEFEIQALIEYEFRRLGSWDTSYGSIVATGANATILHYGENSDECKDGDLLLIDAGCEYMGYASDITRTLPVNGRFSKAQRLIMDIVAEAHAAAIEVCKVGTPYIKMHEAAELALIEGLRRIKILKASVKEILEKKTHKKYYPHGTGHWLGLDVHDPCPTLNEKGESLKFVSGMITTVEPGLYFMESDTSVPKEFRGIGVRIEDDIVITKNKPEILTEGLPRYAAEIEKFMKN